MHRLRELYNLLQQMVSRVQEQKNNSHQLLELTNMKRKQVIMSTSMQKVQMQQQNLTFQPSQQQNQLRFMTKTN